MAGTCWAEGQMKTIMKMLHQGSPKPPKKVEGELKKRCPYLKASPRRKFLLDFSSDYILIRFCIIILLYNLVNFDFMLMIISFNF
jgi:hypothetical protein